MSLFLKQTQERSQLQSKIAADMESRAYMAGAADKMKPKAGAAEESKVATGRSLFWAGVATMVVIAVVVFLIFTFES